MAVLYLEFVNLLVRANINNCSAIIIPLFSIFMTDESPSLGLIIPFFYAAAILFAMLSGIITRVERHPYGLKFFRAILPPVTIPFEQINKLTAVYANTRTRPSWAFCNCGTSVVFGERVVISYATNKHA
eukprot:GHVT01093892.1.p1 GENE.GHVT01093892.1~~GHVT01093892.1.p1  ORF type:complete len:129 (+),score=3.32 GHVT01093892.1:181-567(+)